MNIKKINYQQIIDSLLELKSQDLTSTDKRKLTIIDNEENKLILNEINIEYGEINNNGKDLIEIDLDQNDFYIRKTKEHFLQTCHNCVEMDTLKFRRSILLIDDKISYSKETEAENIPVFFKNVLFSFELLNLFKKKIADFDNVLEQKFILLSPTAGKAEVSYVDSTRIEIQKFFDNVSNDLGISIRTLKYKIKNDSSFISFFKDSFIEKNESCFFNSLLKIKDILNVAERNFELYQKKFDFNEFEKGLQGAKEDYFKKHFEFQSGVLSNINSFPIQFGIYIFLLARFSDNPLGLVIMILLLFGWSFFSIKTIGNLETDINNLHKDFDTSLIRIKEKSGLKNDEFTKYQNTVKDTSDRSLDRLKWFKWLYYVFSFVLFVIAVVQIYTLINQCPISPA